MRTVRNRIFWRTDRFENWLCDRKWSRDWMYLSDCTRLQRLLCAVGGHQVIDDHCGKPEHRYCMYDCGA